jgi:hypothetical protein
VHIVPNPAHEYIFLDVINANAAKRTSIRIYDMEGKLKAKLTGGNNVKVYVKNWPDGMYTVEVNNSGIIGLKKIIIKH